MNDGKGIQKEKREQSPGGKTPKGRVGRFHQQMCRNSLKKKKGEEDRIC